jgi:hypothetical protein
MVCKTRDAGQLARLRQTLSLFFSQSQLLQPVGWSHTGVLLLTAEEIHTPMALLCSACRGATPTRGLQGYSSDGSDDSNSSSANEPPGATALQQRMLRGSGKPLAVTAPSPVPLVTALQGALQPTALSPSSQGAYGSFGSATGAALGNTLGGSSGFSPMHNRHGTPTRVGAGSGTMQVHLPAAGAGLRLQEVHSMGAACGNSSITGASADAQLAADATAAGPQAPFAPLNNHSFLLPSSASSTTHFPATSRGPAVSGGSFTLGTNSGSGTAMHGALAGAPAHALNSSLPSASKSSRLSGLVPLATSTGSAVGGGSAVRSAEDGGR